MTAIITFTAPNAYLLHLTSNPNKSWNNLLTKWREPLRLVTYWCFSYHISHPPNSSLSVFVFLLCNDLHTVTPYLYVFSFPHVLKYATPLQNRSLSLFLFLGIWFLGRARWLGYGLAYQDQGACKIGVPRWESQKDITSDFPTKYIPFVYFAEKERKKKSEPCSSEEGVVCFPLLSEQHLDGMSIPHSLLCAVMRRNEDLWR